LTVPAGNLINSDSGQAFYSKGNRLSLYGDRHFQYDNRGNLSEEKRGKSQQLHTDYQYNGWNQLASVVKDGFKTLYRYDALGRRIGKSANRQIGHPPQVKTKETHQFLLERRSTLVRNQPYAQGHRQPAVHL
tara:strand:- start:54676 stop:55071 length:396 start_codon:yes stop_codon:yes gene_type:complete